MASDRDDERLRTLLKWAEGWAQSNRYGPEWRSAFRCVAGQVRFLLGDGEAEPEPSPREIAIRELEALRDDLVNVAGAPAPAWAIQRIDKRLAKLREVKP